MHDVWHITVLAATLFAGAGLVILLLGPLVFERPPPGLRRVRPVVAALVAMAAVLVLLEWTVVH